MAAISNQIGQDDVTRWGVAALVAGGLAVLSLSLTAIVPDGLAIGLHATRIEGGSVNVLREQVAYLLEQQNELERGTDQIESQMRLNARDQGEMVQRLSALETAIPSLLEHVPPDAEIDNAILTGSVDDDEGVESFEVDGGTVTVSQRPIYSGQPEPTTDEVIDAIPQLPPPLLNTNLPAELVNTGPDSNEALSATRFGLAIGGIVTEDSALAAWEELRATVGTLLIGLAPALSEPPGTEGARIVVGPIEDYDEAEELCLRISRSGVPCLPIEYADERLLQLSELAREIERQTS